MMSGVRDFAENEDGAEVVYQGSSTVEITALDGYADAAGYMDVEPISS
eukprot:CAMPEP_0206317820 /NCGR_PEP_ID=MMETSP0106_2-20121207/16839_1 /ASSEMBLY_ACC=CAM_ASM_000206 /TAXON_ID=81532 /ORGANISM="Acanthoeca-like sp., Strain 10tr" /LENGTH=47 /DNA_ID= /DNA_START= /DNA_END= /DNA_ORIENTATION=